MTSRPPTARQRQCFEAFARTGEYQAAADELGLSRSRVKANCAEYYRRINARNGIQAAYLTWAMGVVE